MPIIPKLNLKAAVRIHDEALNSAALDQPSSSGATVPESIVTESRPCDVKPALSGDEFSPPQSHDDFDYDDVENDFKSPPPCLLNNDFRVELTEGGDSPEIDPSDKIEPADQNITSRPIADLVHSDQHAEVSMQSFSDGDSVSGHSIQSDTSYTKEALQIVSNTSKQQLQQSTNFTDLKEPPSPSPSSVSDAPSRKRRRAMNKLTSDPAHLPLCDLLFYNPPPTIFQSKAQEDLNNNKDDSDKKVIVPAKRRSSRANSVASEASNKSGNDLLDEDDFMKSGDENSEKDIPTNTGASDEPMLMLDESGNIVIKNPNALAKEKDKKPEAKMKSSTTYNSFRRRERSKNVWNTQETGMFYTALEIVGTDFSLMEAVFFKDSGRSRKQLKQKFKREEKINRDYIDSILYKSLRNRSKLTGQLLEAAAGQANTTDDSQTSPPPTPPVASSETSNIVVQTA